MFSCGNAELIEHGWTERRYLLLKATWRDL